MKIKTILCDFSRVLLFPQDPNYIGSLSKLYREESEDKKFQFRHHFRFNTDLIDYFKSVKDQYPCHIFTTSTIHKLPEILAITNGVFSRSFTVPEVGYDKTDPTAFTHIASQLNIDPQGILFIDDNTDNVKAALHAGLQGCHFHNTPKLIAYLSTIL